MKKVAIVYYSRHGQTAKIAHEMADRFRHLLGASVRVGLVEIPPVGDLPPFPWEAETILIGAPLRLARYPRKVAEWVHRYLPDLECRQSAFFSVSLNAADPRPESRLKDRELVEIFMKKTGWQPDEVGIFAGALMYLKYHWPLRMVMKWISSRAGGPTDTTQNHELTDWTRVNAFVHQIAGQDESNQNEIRLQEKAQ